jgi:iron-sulfur cluster repair protein YtfE (RIC family)
MSLQDEVITFASVVNDVIQSHPGTTNVFNEFGIDACCGGAVSIHDAALRDGADPAALLSALNTVIVDQQRSAGTAA